MKIKSLIKIGIIIPVVMLLSGAQTGRFNQTEPTAKASFTMAKGQNHLPPRQSQDPTCA